MLLLTNGIARNSTLSYEHVRDRLLSRYRFWPILPPIISLSLFICPFCSVNPFPVVLFFPLALCLSISTVAVRRLYPRCFLAFYDSGGGDDGIVAVRVSCEGVFTVTTAAKERLVFVGHSVVVDETETFVLRPRRSCSNYLKGKLKADVTLR